MDNAEQVQATAAAVPGARAFNREVAPAFIDHVCITSGYAPPPGSPIGDSTGASFTYCELHSASAVTTTLLAASNPFGDFHAIDPRKQMIAAGQALADDGKVRNITFHECGIEAALAMSLPAFDYIVVHGIYSWVPLQERALVLAFLRKFLKPGGAVYVTYNARPGADRMEPFRRLVRETGRGLDVVQRVALARDLYGRLAEARAPAIVRGVAPDALARLTSLPPNALAAEYGNDYVDALYVTEVVSDFAAIDCTLAGTAEMGDSVTVLQGHEPFKALFERIPSPGARELAKDYLLDTPYRRDVFVRGGRRLAADNREAVLGGLAFALEQSPVLTRFDRRMAFGELHFDNPHARTIVQSLVESPRTLGELIERGSARGSEPEAVAGNLHALLLAGQIRPVYRATRQAAEGARAMAAAVRKRSLGSEAVGYLPAACGTAFAVPVPDQLFLDAGDGTPDEVVERVLERVESNGQSADRAELSKRYKVYQRLEGYYDALGLR